MRKVLWTIVLSSLTLTSMAALADDRSRLEVPFSFTAKGHNFPAGSYYLFRKSGSGLITLSSRSEPGNSLTWIIGPAEVASSPVVLKFDGTGTEHMLRTIQFRDRVTPTLDNVAGGESPHSSSAGQ
jgi:hypothetical protein